MPNEKRPKLRALSQGEIARRVYELGIMQCTPKEIGATLGILESEVYNVYGDMIKKAKEEGKQILRVEQWRTAIEFKNWKMQMWLGKQYLGQREPEKMAKEEIQGTPEETREKLIEVLQQARTMYNGEPPATPPANRRKH